MTTLNIFRCRECGGDGHFLMVGDGRDPPCHCPWTGSLAAFWELMVGYDDNEPAIRVGMEE